MANTTRNVMDAPLNDPITKAVVDNIMGNLPTKKPPVRCLDCDLCFTSQTVLECHLQGARHAKQIRSKTIMATLEETKVAFTKGDEEANGLRCNVCNVCLNSIQQLQTHLNGNRHKKKAMKGGWTGIEVTQGCSLASSSTVTSIKMSVPAKNTVNSSIGNTKSGANSSGNKGVSFSCDVCNKFFNSKAQYDVHIASKKHTDRLNRGASKNLKKKRFFPYWKKSKVSESADPQIPIPSLANNFVSGGYNS